MVQTDTEGVERCDGQRATQDARVQVGQLEASWQRALQAGELRAELAERERLEHLHEPVHHVQDLALRDAQGEHVREIVWPPVHHVKCGHDFRVHGGRVVADAGVLCMCSPSHDSPAGLPSGMRGLPCAGGPSPPRAPAT